MAADISATLWIAFSRECLRLVSIECPSQFLSFFSRCLLAMFFRFFNQHPNGICDPNFLSEWEKKKRNICLLDEDKNRSLPFRLSFIGNFIRLRASSAPFVSEVVAKNSALARSSEREYLGQTLSFPVVWYETARVSHNRGLINCVLSLKMNETIVARVFSNA